MRKIPAHVREQQINEIPDVTFVRWDGEYRNNQSKVVCECSSGHTFVIRVNDLINHGQGCSLCSRKQWSVNRITPPDRVISRINKIEGVMFVRWIGDYTGVSSRALCRCINGHEWSLSICNSTRSKGCPTCIAKMDSIRKRKPESVRIDEINSFPNVTFVKWTGEYINKRSKATCRCDHGHEWSAMVCNLIKGTGCPVCSVSGYNPLKPGTLYALRSQCGTMIKIGISNEYNVRHCTLARTTPFEWDCVELIHGDGALISSLEKAFHGLTEPVVFKEPFDGYTEWRKWDNRIHEWFSNWREMVQCR